MISWVSGSKLTNLRTDGIKNIGTNTRKLAKKQTRNMLLIEKILANNPLITMAMAIPYLATPRPGVNWKLV
ncbi:MAG: hypothetical protein Q7U35_10825 [Methanobacteriaceae archaeon]|nr:hypothetical protein [Methanobacteriaceae archaeon]MDP2837011.1 hypothetical protein [Methanobacteriaceae archaeon]MDP3034817.1 hypothetical protein [Methanobacteriaceae archaeon]MDP3485797.1 hypothetical protein [Methanobacteriaceae archaeon]MDP3624440.1 hypothetical protein [Methanobacteriaceae archaeon]